jgi:metal-dependent amidase/aminoacylase/carboxypeptidase family protein
MPVVNRFADLAPAITAWRRDLHEHPENCCSTPTAPPPSSPRSCADSAATRSSTGIGRTGVVGVIRGRRPARAR